MAILLFNTTTTTATTITTTTTTAASNAGGFTYPNLTPALSPQVQVILTAVFLGLFSILFLSVYVQLYMILWYRHKHCSYQSVMLFMILIWSALRIVLFSMYFSEVYLANHLPLFISWLLYCLPICLQFFTLCLITSFFTSAYLKGQDIGHKMNRNVPNILLGISAILFFVVNLTFATLSMKAQREQNEVVLPYVYARVAINDGLFLTVAASLIIVIVRLMKVPITKRSLEAKAITMWTVVGVSIFVIFTYGSRALYNMIAVIPALKGRTPSFGYGWFDVSDQADVVNLSKGNAYLSFTTVLTIWEFLPLVAVLAFFRVKPYKSKNMIANNGRQYFHDEKRSLLRNRFLILKFRNFLRPANIQRTAPININGVTNQFTNTYPPLGSPRYGTTSNTLRTIADIHSSP